MEQRSAFEGVRNACTSAGKSIPSTLDLALDTRRLRVCARVRVRRGALDSAADKAFVVHDARGERQSPPA